MGDAVKRKKEKKEKGSVSPSVCENTGNTVPKTPP